MILFEDIVHTSYGQFDLIWDPDWPGFDGDVDAAFADQVNGLVGAAGAGGVYLHFGRYGGGSSVTIELMETEPALVTGAWEDIVEVSVTVPEGSSPVWSSWAGESGGPLALPAGTYRLRVSERGRDAGRADEFADSVIDHYLLQFWPSPRRPDAIIATASVDAGYWHREWGSRHTS